MSAATSLGYSYQRFKWPLQSLPFSSFSSQARCLGLRVLILGVAAVSSGMGILSTDRGHGKMFSRHCGRCATLRRYLRRIQIVEKHPRRAPSLSHNDTTRAFRGAPAARATPAVRSFGYAEIADGVVYHDRARAETLGNVFPALGVAGPDTGGKCERRIISARNGFFGVPNRLNGKDRPERLFLKQPHRRIDSRDDCRLEKIGTKIGTRMATAQHFRAARDSIVDQVAHALQVLRPNERADIGGRITSRTEAELPGFLHAKSSERIGDGLLHEEPFDR